MWFVIGVTPLRLAWAAELANFPHWERVRTTGERISGRSAAQAVSYRSRIYLFGGVRDDFDTQTNTYYSDLFVLDTVRRRWSRHRGAGPSARAHSAVAVDERHGVIYLFGGIVNDFETRLDPATTTVFDDLWSFDVARNRWKQITPVGDTRPSARGLAKGFFFDGGFYVFGGTDRFVTVNSELWRFDVASRTWTVIPPSGEVPAPRFNPEVTMVPGRGAAYLAGGIFITAMRAGDFWRYDVLSNTWTQLSVGISPPRLAGTLTTACNNVLVYYGGDLPDGSPCCGSPVAEKPSDDTYLYHIPSGTWTLLSAADLGFAPPALEYHAAATAGGRTYVMGGFAFEPVNEVGQIFNESTFRFGPIPGCPHP